jgi:hypothetical protein
MPFVEIISVSEDNFPRIRVIDKGSGIGRIQIFGIQQGNGITIDIIENLVGLMYRAGEEDLITGPTRITYSTAFPPGTLFILDWEVTALSDGAIIGGTVDNTTDLDGFDVDVNEPAHITYKALIKV